MSRPASAGPGTAGRYRGAVPEDRGRGRARPAAEVLSTIWSGDDQAWNDAVDVADGRNARWLPFVLSTAWAARRYRTLVLLGSLGRRDLYRDLVIAVLVRRCTNRRARIVLTDCTWSPGSATLAGGRRWLQRLLVVGHRALVRAVDGPSTVFCVLTEAERRIFPAAWQVPAGRVVATPFSHTMWDHEDLVPPRGDYVFAGGDSMRDYDLLVEACRGLDAPVVIATRLPVADPPANVRVSAMSHEDYVQALLGAGVVVVPLRDDGHRSAGQQTYLNAMLLGKPVVVTDSLGVRELVTDGVDGFVSAADPVALRAALERCLSRSADELDELGRVARQSVLRSSRPTDYLARLLDVARGRPTARPGPEATAEIS